MLPTKNRLPSRLLFTRPKTIHTEYFVIRFQQNTVKYNRYGFVVSKKVAKKAVDRNAVKRRFRACVESAEYLNGRGYDVLFVLKRKALDAKTPVLCSEIITLLSTQRII